jgi:cholesterol transport system auxiliary component
MLVLVLLSMIAGGCAAPFGPREAEATRIFLLTRAEPSSPRLNPAGPSILVSRPRAAPGFAGVQMIYTETPFELDSFAHHRWADTPANMLEPLVVAALENSGLFREVATAATRARTDLRLDSELLRMVQVFSSGRSRVEVAMRVSLIGAASSELIDSRLLEVVEPADEGNPYAGVEAANRAVARLLDEVGSFLARNLASQ